jgi:hypothetical protein
LIGLRSHDLRQRRRRHCNMRPTQFDPGRAHAPRDIRGRRDAKAGGLTKTRTKLNSAAKRSDRTRPPHGFAILVSTRYAL